MGIRLATWLVMMLVLILDRASSLNTTGYVFLERSNDMGKDYTEIRAKIEKGRQDSSDYKLIRLVNGLEVLLISDSEASNAIASMAVNVGYGNDPEDVPGVAHLIEHLLFTGNTRYPNPKELENFSSHSSGLFLAVTGYDHTYFYFELGVDSIKGGLDRLANMFISPLLLNESLYNEIIQIEYENDHNDEIDTFRLDQIVFSSIDSKHPFAHFSDGNRETLINRPLKRNKVPRDIAKEFYQRHYYPENMKLVVRGKESIGELSDMVVSYFSYIEGDPNRKPSKGKKISHLKQPVSEIAYSKIIRIVSEKDVKKIELNFVINQPRENYIFKTEAHISSIICHEGPGSLIASLKSQLRAESIQCEIEYFVTFSVFRIKLEVTELGLENQYEVIEEVFSMIQSLKDKGFSKEMYQEDANLRAINFNYKQIQDPLKFVCDLAKLMHQDILAEHILSHSKVMNYDVDRLSNTLDFLDRNKVIIAVSYKLKDGEENLKTEPWYNGLYREEKLDMSQFKVSEKMFQLPQKNRFTPSDFTIIPDQKIKSNLLINKPGTKLWYFKNPFRLPEIEFRFLINHPIFTPRHQVLLKFVVKQATYSIATKAFGAKEAGLDYKLDICSRGLLVTVQGISHKLFDLVEIISQALKEITIKLNEFTNIKDQLVTELTDAGLLEPIDQARYYIDYALNENQWSHALLGKELEKIAFDDVAEFFGAFKSGVSIESLVIGNIDTKNALDLFKKMKQPFSNTESLKLRFSHQTSYPKAPYKAIHPMLLSGTTDVTVICIYFDIYDYKDINTRTHVGFLVDYLKPAAFDHFRAKEIANTVFINQVDLKTRGGIEIVAESEADPVWIEEEVFKFFKLTIESIYSLEYGDILLMRKTKHRFLKHPPSLYHLAERYWSRIYQGHTDFNIDLDGAIDGTKSNHLSQLLKTYLIDGAPQLSKVSIHMYNPLNTEITLPTSYENNTMIENLEGWKSNLDYDD